MMHSELFLDVRYYETDQMGIVHHSNYISYGSILRFIKEKKNERSLT